MHRILLALVLLLPLAPQPTEAFVFKKIVYCSPIEGLIHWQGKPLADLKVTRLLRSGGFENDEYQDHVQTNSEGRFQFQTVAERRFLRPDLLSANPRVSQTLEVSYEGSPYTIWSYSKHDFNLGTESKDGVIRIECDLAKFEEFSFGRIVRCQHNGNQPL
ncbi:DUF6795 domain-containing protein [uncultured Limnobacter sp.]|uniref:DUF6795 domain-containing protein n=1 Tax=uncultured Limnobacter sp. TaxID=199681 RepID=UPI0030F8D830